MIKYCHPMYEKKCKSNVHDLVKCKLWENFYCVDVENLTKTYNFTFEISLKNANSSSYGDITTFSAYTQPGSN